MQPGILVLLLLAAPVIVKSPTAAPLVDGDHYVLPISARGQVVFSPDGAHLAYLNGGKLYLANLKNLVRDGKKARVVKLADVDALSEYPVAAFSSAKKTRLVAATKDAHVVIAQPGSIVGLQQLATAGDGQSISISPDGELYAKATKDFNHVGKVNATAGKNPLIKAVRFGAWSQDGKSLIVTATANNDIQRVDPETGKATTLIRGADIKKLCGVELGDVTVEAVAGSGDNERLLLTARQALPKNGKFGSVSYEVPKGAERRGRNPGSAEPDPLPPSWTILHAGGKNTILSVNWAARRIDNIRVLPSRKLDRFLYVQMAQKGGAGDGHEPECWLGTIDEKGKKVEKKLAKSPFPPTMRDIQWQFLDVSDDASKALALVVCNIEMRKPIKDALDLALLSMKYGTGGRMEGKTAVLKFQAWSLWVFDAKAGQMKQLSKLYAEKYDELKKVSIGLEGKLGTFGSPDLSKHIGYSRAAGVVALSLNRQTVFNRKQEILAPVVLLKVPKW